MAKHRFYALSNSAEAVLNLALSLVLVRYYGMLGVALGTLLPMVLVKIFVQPWWVCRVAGIPLRSYAGSVVSTTARCLFLFLLVLLGCSWGRVPDYKAMVPSIILATVIFSIGAWFLVFQPQERQRLRSVLPSPFRLPSTGTFGA